MGPRSLPPCQCPLAPGVNILKCSSNHNSALVVRGRGLLTACREVHTLLLQSMPFHPAWSFFGFLSFFFHSFTCIFKSHRGIAYVPHHTNPENVSATMTVLCPMSRTTLLVLVLRKQGIWSAIIWGGLERVATRFEFDSWVGKMLWRSKWQPAPVFLPEESQGQKNLAGDSPWDCKISDITEWLGTRIYTQGRWQDSVIKDWNLSKETELCVIGNWETRRILKRWILCLHIRW